MSIDLMKFGLALQAASIGKGPLATSAPKPESYRPPLEKVCPSCGRKHTRAFQLCLSCSQKE